MAPRIGIQLYTVRTVYEIEVRGKTEIDWDIFQEVLGRVSSIGFQGFELAGVPTIERDGARIPVSAAEIRGAAEGLGLEIFASHEVKPLLDTDLAGRIAFNRGLRAPGKTGYIVLPWMGPDDFDTPEKAQKLVDFLHNVGREATAKPPEGLSALRVLYHNHGPELSTTVEGKPALYYMKGICDSRHLSFQPDLYWVEYGGKDVGEFLTDFHGRFPVIHFKDGILEGDQRGQFRALGEGEAKLEYAVLMSERSPGVKWATFEQDNHKYKPNGKPSEVQPAGLIWENTEKSYAWLRSHIIER